MSFVIRAREVGTSELSKEFYRLAVVGANCIEYILVGSAVYLLSIKLHLSLPVRAICGNTLVPGSVIAWLFAITTILGIGRWTKIGSYIIESVAVNVIYITIGLQDFTMHLYNATVSIFIVFISRSINIRCGSGWNWIPKTLVEFTKVFCTNVGIQSSRQWNYFDRLIERLDNSVPSIHVVFHKEPSFLVRLSAALFNFNNYIMLEAN